MERVVLLLFFVAALALGSCDKNEPIKMKPQLSGFLHSECGGFKSSALNDEEEKEVMVIHSTDEAGTYLFEHSKVSFNCCLPAGLSATSKVINDTIYVNEKETELGTCRCLCSYDLTYELTNLEKGNYVLCLMRDSVLRGSTTLFFDEGMYEEFDISEFY